MADHANPGAGDPYAIRQAATDREDKARELRDVLTAAQEALERTDADAWTGASRLLFEQHIQAALPELQLLQSSLDAVAAALRTYADEIAAIKDLQDTLERRRSRLEGERADIDRRWRSADSMGDLFSEELALKADRLALELSGVKAEIAEASGDWDALVKRRERADADCIAALQSRDVRGNLAGLPDAVEVTTEQLLDTLTKLTATEMRLLLASNPELLARLHKANPMKSPNGGLGWEHQARTRPHRSRTC